MFIFAALLAVHVGLAGTIPTAPENITVTFINPQSVRVSWQIASNLLRKPIEKYLVTFKPTNDRVVQQVAGHSEAVVLDHLLPNTQYQLTVTAVVRSHRYKSRQITFKTLELTRGGSGGDSMAPHSGHSLGVFSDSAFTSTTGSPPNATTRELPTIRGVEVGIVVLVLIVWAGAIALFFNRWGKIRMLLPYQPDYKQEQLKVPGTGVCSGSACNGQHSHQEPKPTQISTPSYLLKEPLYNTKEPLLLHNQLVQHRSLGVGIYSRLIMSHCTSLIDLELEDAESVSSRRQITMGYVELLQKIQDDFPDEESSVKENSYSNSNVATDDGVREGSQSECEGSELGSLVNTQSKSRHFHYLDEPSTTISDRCTRNRINSAIFVSSEGRGFDSIEFLRRHGSQSVLCRKARSAENISDEDRKRRFSDNQQWATEDSSHPSETIELVECHQQHTHTSVAPANIKPPPPPAQLSTTTTHTASIAVTTTPSKFIATASAIATAINKANSIVGSISIETPPSELVTAPAPAPVSIPVPVPPPMAAVQATPTPPSIIAAVQTASVPPLHQNTNSTAPSPNIVLATPNNSPARLSLKTSNLNAVGASAAAAVVATSTVKQPLTNLPTLSISQPSPPAEGEFL